MELEVGAMASGGGCVGRAPDGRVVFVRHALPGERVVAAVTGETSRFLRADAVRVLEPSPDRVEPPCPFAGPGRCGGCDWQHVDVAAQRRLKAGMVAEQLRRIAGVETGRGGRVGAPGRRTGSVGGRGSGSRSTTGDSVGFRRHRSHAVEPVDGCRLASKEVESVGVEGRTWVGVREIEVFGGPGIGGRVTSVTGRQRRALAPATAAMLDDVDGGLVVDGRTVRPPRRVEVDVLGRPFIVSAGVFWQVHPGARGVAGRTPYWTRLGPRPGETVADLLCRGRSSSRSSSVEPSAGPARSCAVERDRRACADATQNAADLPQVDVVRATGAPALVARGLGTPDLVVLDPAREGAGKPVMAALAGLRPPPRRIAYFLVRRRSFARDVRVLLTPGGRCRHCGRSISSR